MNYNGIEAPNSTIETKEKTMFSEECKQKIVVVQDTTALIIMGLLFIVIVIGLFYYLPKWTPSQDCNFSQKNRENSLMSVANPELSEDEDFNNSSPTYQTKMHSPHSITFAE